MEDPPILLLPPQNSKKRMFSGGGGSSSSSPFIVPDLIEIQSNPLQKNSIINVDGEDSDDIVVNDEKIAPTAKGKVVANDGAHYLLEKDSFKEDSNSCVSFIDDDFEFGEMEFPGSFSDEEYAKLQTHFDNMDIPSGVEAIFPWWASAAAAGSDKQYVTSNVSSVYGTQSNSTVEASGVDQVQSMQSHKNLPSKNSGNKKKNHGWEASSGLETSGMFSSEFDSWPLTPGLGPINSSSNAQTMMPPEFDHWPMTPGHGLTLSSSAHSRGMIPSEFNYWPMTPGHGQNVHYLSGWPIAFGGLATSLGSSVGSHCQDSSIRLDEGIAAQISPPCSNGQENGSENPLVKKLELFKKFDNLEDYSGHLYCNTKESCSQSKGWMNKIAEEWRMLERDLPGMIFVRVYEARMDLLRAVIVGAHGTPYHDGLFFFDVNFPRVYPNGPPRVKYHAHGLRINPNLYNCGNVCLSLLGTWSGSDEENWRPGESNMLQVLLSIQGLILNAEPFFNEPGFESFKNRLLVQQQSMHYSENTFLLSLKTMLYTLKNPPKYFEDLVFGHFYTRAHDILAACKAYLNGAEVGSFDKNRSQDSQVNDFNCSELLQANLPIYIKSLVEAFTKIGVQDCGKYLVPVDKASHHPNTAG